MKQSSGHACGLCSRPYSLLLVKSRSWHQEIEDEPWNITFCKMFILWRVQKAQAGICHPWFILTSILWSTLSGEKVIHPSSPTELHSAHGQYVLESPITDRRSMANTDRLFSRHSGINRDSWHRMFKAPEFYMGRGCWKDAGGIRTALSLIYPYPCFHMKIEWANLSILTTLLDFFISYHKVPQGSLPLQTTTLYSR